MEELYSRPQFLDASTCRRIRLAMDAGAADEAEVLDSVVAVRTHTRRAASIDIDEMTMIEFEARLDREREGIATFFGVDLDGREGPGFLRYYDGGFYQAHRDRATVASWPAAARRRIAIVTFLNGGDEFDGGILRIYLSGRVIDISPAAGLLVAFDADLVHEVTTVRRGTRDAVVDWFYDREA